MSIDLTKLAPAPFITDKFRDSIRDANEDEILCLGRHGTPDILEFTALARNAFQIMMDRHWTPLCQFNPKMGDYDFAAVDEKGKRINGGCYDDPYTAIVEADAWVKRNAGAR